MGKVADAKLPRTERRSGGVRWDEWELPVKAKPIVGSEGVYVKSRRWASSPQRRYTHTSTVFDAEALIATPTTAPAAGVAEAAT